MNSEDFKIYRDYSIEKLSKDACTNFLQNLARCDGHIASSVCLSNGYMDISVRNMSMFFRIYFTSPADLTKFHQLGMTTTLLEDVGI